MSHPQIDSEFAQDEFASARDSEMLKHLEVSPNIGGFRVGFPTTPYLLVSVKPIQVLYPQRKTAGPLQPHAKPTQLNHLEPALNTINPKPN